MMEGGLFKIECLTPVHIGSGEELVRGIDFFSAEGFTEVLDPALVLKAFGAFEGFAENIMRGGAGIGAFLKSRGSGVAACRLYRASGTIEAQKLRVAIRTGDGRPIIPGSSIKGALRTLLLTAWATEGGPHAGKRPGPVIDALWKAGYGHRTSSQQLEEAVFHFSREGLRANDPRTDLLRTLAVSDAMFAPGSLKVVSSVAAGTVRNTLTAAEALEPGACALTALRAGDGFVDARLPFLHQLPDLQTLAGWSHQHARHLFDGDLNYFKSRNEDAMARRLEDLLAEVEHSPADAIILRLGWGTGWRTMTGDILTPDERNRVMGRVGKTRKV
ncbi:MAG: type III-A CRISPR-associated RAMP protein Csm5 [Candidatus Binataceae bacterium]